MHTATFDQNAIDRYMASQVTDKLDPQPSKLEGLTLPWDNKDRFLRDYLIKHYPVGSAYSEVPKCINFFCANTIEMCQTNAPPLSKHRAYVPVESAILEAVRLVNQALVEARVAAALAAIEIDPEEHFKKVISEIEGTFLNHISYLRSRYQIEMKHYPDKGKESLINKIEAAVEHYLSEFMSKCESICMDLRRLITLRSD